MKKQSLEAQAKEILELAAEKGLEENYFFVTTFNRYQVQIEILNSLEKAIKAGKTLTTKEYVKGRENIYTHPAINEYNRTASAANQTVGTLIKIIRKMGEAEKNEDDDGFESFINSIRS